MTPPPAAPLSLLTRWDQIALRLTDPALYPIGRAVRDHVRSRGALPLPRDDDERSQALRRDAEAAGLLPAVTAGTGDRPAPADFWISGWLECAAYAALVEVRRRRPELVADILRGQDIHRIHYPVRGDESAGRRGEAPEVGPPIGDIDAAVVCGCRLVLFECKDWQIRPDGRLTDATDARAHHFKEVVDGVAQRRRLLGGTYGIGYLITADLGQGAAATGVREQAEAARPAIELVEVARLTEPLAARFERDLARLRPAVTAAAAADPCR